MMIDGHEPGGFRDRCSRCGGWISMGHALGSVCQEQIMLEEAEAAMKRIDARKGENVEAWAKKLGDDLGSFTD